MYRKIDKHPEFEKFWLPFGGHLRETNRWVKLAQLIPWNEVEMIYESQFSENGMGAPAKSVRTALGSLIIKEKLGLTDEETVEQIRENPYLQYFIGMECYKDEAPFDPSMMVHFRKRLNYENINALNESIIEKYTKDKKNKDKASGEQAASDNQSANGHTVESTNDKTQREAGSDENKKEIENNQESINNGIEDKTIDGTVEKNKTNEPIEEIKNRGKLIADATCTPADIRYPTDINLLNEGREKAEEIIDKLFKPLIGKETKPRTNRKKARKEFVKLIKKGRLTIKDIGKGIRKQLSYLRHDLEIIKQLVRKTKLSVLSKKQYKDLLVIHEVYRQQDYMYANHTHHIEGRIVSISQPHVRPIVRGKAGKPVEFGAKISISLINGFCYLDRLDWEPYNESTDLITQSEEYKRRFGCYPESIHADKIYRNSANRKYCERKGIRLSGQSLGKRKAKEANSYSMDVKQIALDEKARIPVEGKFGNAKRRYTLDLVMSKLPDTSATTIAITFLVMNLDLAMRGLFLSFKFVCNLIIILDKRITVNWFLNLTAQF